MSGRKREQGLPKRFVDGGEGNALDRRIGAYFRHAIEAPGLSDGAIEAVGQALRTPARPLRRPLFQLAAALVLISAAGAAALVGRSDCAMLHRWSSNSPRRGTFRAARGSAVPGRDAERSGCDAGRSGCDAQRRGPRAGRAAARIQAPVALAFCNARTAACRWKCPTSLHRRPWAPRRVSCTEPSRPCVERGMRDEPSGCSTSTTRPSRRAPARERRPLGVDALLMLHRRADALALLDAAMLDAGPRADELLVTRGELRAEDDCTRGLRDFDQALARKLSDKLAERALRGRAVCRMQMVGARGAEQDLRAYLLRFPSGKLAATLRELLDAH